MGFEKDYNEFMKAILNNELLKVEEILSQSDNRNSYLHKALSDFGHIKILTVIEKFRAQGLKKELFVSVEEYKGVYFNLNDFQEKKESVKIIRTHEKNKISNEKYHLSGSSFKDIKVQEIA